MTTTEMTAEKKLTELKRGQTAEVCSLDTDDQRLLRKLMSMGIMPGIRLKVLQTFPSYVIQAGYTQVAVDKMIASAIIVYV